MASCGSARCLYSHGWGGEAEDHLPSFIPYDRYKPWHNAITQIHIVKGYDCLKGKPLRMLAAEPAAIGHVTLLKMLT